MGTPIRTWEALCTGVATGLAVLERWSAGRESSCRSTRPRPRVARILKRRNVAAVAVCFMNAYVNGRERATHEADLEEEMPGLPGLDLFLRRAARNIRARAFLDHRRQRGPEPGVGQLHRPPRRRLEAGGLHARSSVVAHRRWRDDAGERQGFRRAPRRLRHCGGRDRQPLFAMLCGFQNSIGLDMAALRPTSP